MFENHQKCLILQDREQAKRTFRIKQVLDKNLTKNSKVKKDEKFVKVSLHS